MTLHLAVEGEVVVQRSGMINLGIEGMMLAAAMTSTLTQSFLGGIIGAALMAAVITGRVRAPEALGRA